MDLEFNLAWVSEVWVWKWAAIWNEFACVENDFYSFAVRWSGVGENDFYKTIEIDFDVIEVIENDFTTCWAYRKLATFVSPSKERKC